MADPEYMEAITANPDLENYSPKRRKFNAEKKISNVFQDQLENAVTDNEFFVKHR